MFFKNFENLNRSYIVPNYDARLFLLGLDSKDSGTGSSEDGERPAHRLDLLHGGSGGSAGVQGRTESEWSESRADSGPDSPECLYDQREPRHPLQLQHPAYLTPNHGRLLRHPSPESTPPSSQHHHLPPSTSAPSTGSAVTTKPRIWSLADMASKDGDQQNTNPATMTGLTSPYSGTGGGGGGIGGGGGGGGGGTAGSKLVSPLASRLPPHHPLHPIHPGTQFVRPHPDFYRNLYGASHLGSGDISLLETYSRTLGGLGGVIPPSTAPSILTSSSSSISAAGNVKPFSINGGSGAAGGTTVGSAVLLTTASSGLSPSSSSTASSGRSDQSPHSASGGLPATQELKSPGRV